MVVVREVLLTGSVPRTPAASVFEIVAQHLGDEVSRMPDGEQRGWVWSAWEALGNHPSVEALPPQVMTDADTPFRDIPAPHWRLRDGCSPSDVALASFGAAETIADSYRQFRELKQLGVIAERTRLQATVAGPVTVAGPFALPVRDCLAIAEAPIIGDIRAIADAVPHAELTIQMDLPGELETEEYCRRPDAFGVPFVERTLRDWPDWSLQETVGSVARIADEVPDDVELGFHLCALWHIDPRGGQDMQVHVDFANALMSAVSRRIDYIHLPTIPEHGPDDFAKLAGLQLAAQTKLFVGLIHQDGFDEAARRARQTAAVVDDFGVAHFCGLAPALGVDPERLGEMLDLHKQIASVR